MAYPAYPNTFSNVKIKYRVKLSSVGFSGQPYIIKTGDDSEILQSNVTKEQLLGGIDIIIPYGTASVKIIPSGVYCTNIITITTPSISLYPFWYTPTNYFWSKDAIANLNNTTAIVRWHTNNNLNRGTVVYDDPWGKVPVNYKIDSQRTVNERSSYFGVFDTDNTTKKAILIENRLGSTSILQ
jgi:hypothetical protein